MATHRKGDDMSEKTYFYVDGESHYIRTREHLKRVHGPDAELDQFKANSPGVEIHLNPKGHFFWEKEQLRYVSRIYYFTSISGNDSDVYELEAQIRKAGLEPVVI